MLKDGDPIGTVAITGAFSYTGKYATRLLLDRGYRVRTLTYHPDRENPFGDRVKVFPYCFEDPDRLSQSLCGASTLINTYWLRFPRGESTFETAIQNTHTLITAAKKAGVKRIVHVSIANPSAESPLGYYRGKAKVEQAVIDSGMSYAILRPTVIFGVEDILINNIAWFVRHFPVFVVPGNGRYRVRPIYVEDMARLIVDAVDQSGNSVLNAIGPETFTFEGLVRLIAQQLGNSVRLVHLPMTLAYLSTLVSGWFVGDTILTWEEYQGLMGDLLAPSGISSGQTRLSQWLADNRERVGTRYASEVARHYKMDPKWKHQSCVGSAKMRFDTFYSRYLDCLCRASRGLFMGWLQNKFEKNFMISTVDYVFNWARKSAVWPMTFGLACCAIEMIASSTSRFDIARFGSEVFRPSPRQSDLMIVAGTVTLKMAPVVKRIYDQMPDPKWVISMGACSSVGGPFNTYAVLQGVDKIVPVDVYVTGCPPRPENLFYALLKLQDKIDTMTLAKKPTEVRLDPNMVENFKRQVMIAQTLQPK